MGVLAYRQRWSALPVALMAGFVMILYLNACWPWCQSPRRYVCGLVVFALGLAVVLEWARHSRPRTVGVALVLGALCLRSVGMLFDPAARFT